MTWYSLSRPVQIFSAFSSGFIFDGKVQSQRSQAWSATPGPQTIPRIAFLVTQIGNCAIVVLHFRALVIDGIDALRRGQ